MGEGATARIPGAVSAALPIAASVSAAVGQAAPGLPISLPFCSGLSFAQMGPHGNEQPQPQGTPDDGEVVDHMQEVLDALPPRPLGMPKKFNAMQYESRP